MRCRHPICFKLRLEIEGADRQVLNSGCKGCRPKSFRTLHAKSLSAGIYTSRRGLCTAVFELFSCVCFWGLRLNRVRGPSNLMGDEFPYITAQGLKMECKRLLSACNPCGCRNHMNNYMICMNLRDTVYFLGMGFLVCMLKGSFFLPRVVWA